MNIKLAPKTLVGTLHNQNKGAFDWGWQGLLAYGCQSVVAVLDPKSLQVVQVLDRHKNYIVKVKWSKENYHHDLSTPYGLRLASADNYGLIVIWDVTHGAVRSNFSDGSKPIQDMEWMSCDGSHDLLAVIHPAYSLILWNAETGQKLWKKTYTDVIQSLAFDPFDHKNIAFLGQDCILFVDDFSVGKVPSGNGKKFYISSPGVAGSASNSDLQTPEKRSKNKLAKRMGLSRILQLEGDQGKQRSHPEEDAISLNECIQLAYHRMYPNHIILMYSREILILDLDINQTVSTISLERSSSPFIQMMPCQLRDVLILLHENGSVTMRVRRRNLASALNGADQGFGSQDELSSVANYDMTYDARCQSDAVRITKHSRVFGMAVCPVNETSVALLISDSRVLVWELKTVDYHDNLAVPSSQNLLSPLYTPGFSAQQAFDFQEMSSSSLPLTSESPYPKSALSDLIEHTQQFVNENKSEVCRHGVLLKFILTGMCNGVAPPPLVIRMCPPLTTKNWQHYQPMVTLGTSTGIIQVYNLSSGQLWREYSVHSCQVRGIEWVSLQSFLSYGYPTPGSSGLVRNELILVDIQTGKCTKYREHKDEESPIEMLRVSHLRQYFVVTFKDKPFELWDLRQRTLLREMPRNFPHVTAIEWSPSHNMKSLKKKQDLASGSNSQTDASQHLEAAVRQKHESGKAVPPNVIVKEHFVFTDPEGQLYHFMVEGNIIKDGSRIPPDMSYSVVLSNMGAITCIAWKGDTMVLGDVDGNLNIWDLKQRISKTVPTHRGWIKKIKFAPGRGNHKLLVLYSDGMSVWDSKEAEVVSTVKCPKDLPKIYDAEWAASDKPVVTTMDGCVRMLDLKLKVAMAPIEDLQLPDPVFCPHMLNPKGAMILKTLLQHQHWRPSFEFSINDLPSSCKDLEEGINQHLDIMETELKGYLPRCSFGTAERCLLVARLFGDESEVHFWTIGLHYLRAEKAQPMAKTESVQTQLDMGDIFVPSPSASNPKLDTADLLNFDEFATRHPKEQETSWHFIQDKPLETCYHVLMDSHSFQKHQLDRTSLHDTKRVSYENTRQCAENLILLGQADRAVQLLLETEADNDDYYVDCLRACLVASIRSSGASQSTIKLVATNLIANGKLSEGVQLLCLIDKGMDACRYLQTYGQWYKAAWLAKASLSYSECSEVMKRWVDHLCTPNVNQKSKAVLILLSLGQFYKVVEMLYGMHQFDRAALFLEACLEFKLLQRTPETLPLIDAVFLEYARLMCSLQLSSAARHYCSQAGHKGQLFAKEVDIIFSGGDDMSKQEDKGPALQSSEAQIQ